MPNTGADGPVRAGAGSGPERVHVAVGVVEDEAGRILIARRPTGSHQGDRWEFPGGKLEPGESVAEGLARELWEETGIRVASSEPLIRIPHDYADKRVLLDVHRVAPAEATAVGRQGQKLKWVSAAELADHQFPAANAAIVTAVCLPGHYVISPDTDRLDDAAWWSGLDAALASGYRLFQYRVASLGDSEAHARAAVARIHGMGGRCLINGDPDFASRVGADGIHLPSRALARLDQRPSRGWVAASCHGTDELVSAVQLGVDFAVLGPVGATASHPEREPMGWTAFADLVRDQPLPVFALGGLSPNDYTAARRCRGQGIAGIRGFWPTTA